MKWMSDLISKFENQVQTWKRKTRKWAAKFQVYFKKSIFFLSSIAIQKTRGDLQSLTQMTINHNSKCLVFWAIIILGDPIGKMTAWLLIYLLNNAYYDT